MKIVIMESTMLMLFQSGQQELVQKIINESTQVKLEGFSYYRLTEKDETT